MSNHFYTRCVAIRLSPSGIENREKPRERMRTREASLYVLSTFYRRPTNQSDSLSIRA